MKDTCLFLQGDTGVGKTSLILEKIRPYMRETGGFFIQRLTEAGATRAFRTAGVFYESAPCAPYAKNAEGVFIEKTEDGWRAEPEAFIKAVSALLSGFRNKKLILLDEIGGIELLSEQFAGLLQPVLESGIPCIAVIKSEKNAKAMALELTTGAEYEAARRKFMAGIRKKGRIHTLNRRNRPQTEALIDAFLEEAFKAP
jgi:nucleoside-triphosphatase THEP1